MTNQLEGPISWEDQAAGRIKQLGGPTSWEDPSAAIIIIIINLFISTKIYEIFDSAVHTGIWKVHIKNMHTGY